MIIVVFRSRLRPEHQEEYGAEADVIDPIAHAMPGLLSFKTFSAPDGERVTIGEFEDDAAVAAWRAHPRHREAQAKGRERFYAEYQLLVCDVLRERRFATDKATMDVDDVSA